jgi:hypothetical protein
MEAAMRFWFHLCRGTRRSEWTAEGELCSWCDAKQPIACEAL